MYILLHTKQRSVNNMIDESKWKWLGYPEHFCCASKCKFRLATEIGDVVVSTIGDMHNDWYDKERIKVGTSYFETMVFELSDKYYSDDSETRIPMYANEYDVAYYSDALSARNGHREMCIKWAKCQERE